MDSSYSSNYIKVERIGNNDYAIFIFPKDVSETKLKRDLDNIIINEIGKANANKDFGININIGNTKLLEIQEKNSGEEGKGQIFVIKYSPCFSSYLPFPRVKICDYDNYSKFEKCLNRAIDDAIKCIRRYYSVYMN